MAGGCGDASSDASSNSELRWGCFEDVSECNCFGHSPNEEVFVVNGRPVSSCVGFECCLLSEPSDGDPECTCYGQGFDCEAQVATRRNTTIVDSCPLDPPPPGECAAPGESCDLGYLYDQNLEGCCAGSVCDLGDAGIRLCRPGTPEEERWVRECSRAAYSSTTTLAVEQGTVATSVGTFAMSVEEYSKPLVGPGGCVTGLDLRLSENGSASCSLRLIAGPVGSEIRVTSVAASFAGCTGYTGSALPIGPLSPITEDIPFDVALDMISCDWGGLFEGFCTSGRVELRLVGAVGGIEFFDSRLSVSGVACVGEPEGECIPG